MQMQPSDHTAQPYVSGVQLHGADSECNMATQKAVAKLQQT